MVKKTENANTKRIRLNYDINRATMMEMRLGNICDKMNKTTLMAMKRLEIPIESTEQVIAYTNSREALRKAYTERQIEKAKEENGGQLPKVICNLVTRAAEQDFQDAMMAFREWPKQLSKVADTPFIFLFETADGEQEMAVDSGAVEEACTTYLSQQDMPNYNRLCELTKELNDFFQGRIEEPLKRCFFTIPGDKTNTIHLSAGTPFADLRMNQPTETKTQGGLEALQGNAKTED